MRRATFLPMVHTKLTPVQFSTDFDREFEKIFNAINEYATDDVVSSLKEGQDAYFASIDMPGVQANDINIENLKGEVKISAERKQFIDPEGKTIFKYHQKYLLPEDVDAEKIEAHYENGVLDLIFPKKEKEKVECKKIVVQSGPKPKSWLNIFGLSKEKVNKEDSEVKVLS